jgi:secreted PhoX family phosphatase
MQGWSLTRRQFLQFVGATAVVSPGHRVNASWLVSRSSRHPTVTTPLLDGVGLESVRVSQDDSLVVPEGFEAEVLIRQGDLLNRSGDRYGDHNDYLAMIVEGRNAGWVWVNHEGVTLPVVTGAWKPPLTEEQAAECLQNMGGSAIRIARADHRWRPVLPHRRNFRLNGLDSILEMTGPAASSSWVHGARWVTGSTSNCGGGVTPWGSVCSGEENFQDIWGDLEMGDRPLVPMPDALRRPAEHFGYIVEVDLEKRRFFKHTALGRFSHENIAFQLTLDGRLAAYMGDDRDKQCLYKFISREQYRAAAGTRNRQLLTDGTLFVANMARGLWVPLDPAVQPVLRREGFDAARVAVQTRTASSLCGGTPLPRPEDVEVHPETGEVYVALTSWERERREHGERYFGEMAGALGRLREVDGDAGAREFEWDIFVVGSRESGLAWPDNLSWADPDRLLVTTDYVQKAAPIENSPQAILGNNHLLVIPTVGPRAGKPTRFAVAPRGAEFCSPSLTPDRGELWVNVQHPGDNSPGPESWTSHWPDGGDALPRSAMVALRRVAS